MAGVSENVYITGLGTVTALGRCIQSLEQGLRQGRTGLKPFTGFDASFSRCHVAGVQGKQKINETNDPFFDNTSGDRPHPHAPQYDFWIELKLAGKK